MDREKGRGLRRGAGKRQLRTLSGHIAPSDSVLHANNYRGGEGEEGAERWKEVKEMGFSSSIAELEGVMVGDGSGLREEADRTHMQVVTTTTITSHYSKKRPKPQAKALDDCDAVDPAVVPRRLRSAINKRNSQSASPPLSDAKKSEDHATSGAQASNLNGAKRLKQHMVAFTDEEEEVAETLSTLASMGLVANVVERKADGKTSEDGYEIKAIPVSLAEASKEDSKSLLPSNNNDVVNLSLDVSHNETKETGQPASQQTITVSGHASQRSALAFRNEQENWMTVRGAIDFLKPVEASAKSYPVKEIQLATQCDGLPACNPETRLCPFGSASKGQALQPVNKNTDYRAHQACQQERTPNLLSGLPNGAPEHLRNCRSSSEAALWPEVATTASRPSSSRKSHSVKKHPPPSVDAKQPWKRCVIHVQISYLIRNHQDVEKRCHLPPPSGLLKVKESANPAVPRNNEPVGHRNGLANIAPSVMNNLIMERNMHQSRIRMFQDGRLLEAQQASTSTGPYSQPKQGCDLVASPVAGVSNPPESTLKLSGQFPVSFQFQNHTIMRFPFPHGSYPAASSDQLAAAANQQMQLQLPHYMGTTPYGANMVHPGTMQKHQLMQQQQQQQQIWQAHMAQYGLPMTMTKWQNGRPSDSSSLLPCRQSSTVAPELLAGATYNQPPQHQLLPTAPSSSSSSPSSRANRQPHQDGTGFMPEGLTNLQLLCSAQHM